LLSSDAAAEERDPENFDPTVNLRGNILAFVPSYQCVDVRLDYNSINLPVFTCSSRDYIRIKGKLSSFFVDLYSSPALGQVKGDGEPTCFTNPEDTGIPALQQWCHQLTIASRERSARNFFTQLRTFVTSVESYIHGITDVTAADREFLRQRWESNDIYGQTVDMKGVALQLAQV